MHADNLLLLAARPESGDAAFARTVGEEAAACCDLCHGSGFEVVPGRGARRCQCRAAATGGRPLASACIPELYGGCTLANYRPAVGNMTQLRALTYARSLVAEYPHERRGLLFMGAVGTGKTHLAAAILRETRAAERAVSAGVAGDCALFLLQPGGGVVGRVAQTADD